MNNPIISVNNLSVEYVTGIKSVQAVHNVSFEINSGEIFGLVGESGSGKSTVVQAMMRILPPPALISKGNVFINNEDIMAAKLNEWLKFIPQANLIIYSLIRDFIKGIISNIMKESLL